MNSLLRTFCGILIVFCSCSPTKQSTSSQPFLITVNAKTLIPEGIAVHPVSGDVYLSSLHENKIVVVDMNGNVADVIRSAQDGYMWGLGMKFSKDGRILWSCTADGNGKTSLVKIDVTNRSILAHYPHDSARFLNDLVILNDGRIFITDTDKGAVFCLQDGVMLQWLKDEQLKWANGIATDYDNRFLFVASGRYGIQRIDLNTKIISAATQDKRTDYAVDGLVYHDRKLYAAIGWPQDKTADHRILRYQLDKELEFLKADTLAINKNYLTCPTTLAIHKNKLYALGNTNLGVYNRHSQKTDKIMDSLVNPVVSVFGL